MNQDNPVQQRNHSLDLLRMIAMFMILTLHFFGASEAVNVLGPSEINYYLVFPLYFVSEAGVTVFFLLSGYFAQERLRIKSIIFIERKTAFYGVVITGVALIAGLSESVKWSDLIFSEFPVLFDRYWFVSAYVFLSILAPVLVRGLNRASKKLILIIIIALMCNNVFLSYADIPLLDGLNAFIIGYYLKRFKPFERIGKYLLLLFFFLSCALYGAERISVSRFDYAHTALDKGFRYAAITVIAVFLFALFERFETNKIHLSGLSKNILAVYLITVCPAIYDLLYDSWLHIIDYCHEWWFVLYYFAVNVLLFFICILIDKLVTKINIAEAELWIKLLRKIKVVL